MADRFPTWERQVEPQGSLRIPQEGPSLAESFGAGMQDLGQVGGQVAENEARVQAFQQQQQDAADHQTTVKAVLDFSNETDQAYRDAEKNAPPGAAGFSDQTLANFDKAVTEKRKAIPQSQADYFDEQALQMRGSLAGQAAKFQDTSRVSYINDESNKIIGTGAAQLVTNPGKLDFIQKNVFASIVGLPATDSEKQQLATSATQQLKTAALGGLIDQNAPAALKQMQSGAWNDVGAAKLSSFIGQAQQQIKVDEAQRKADARAAEADAKANFNIVFDDAVSTAANTGMQKTVTPADIDKHYTGAAAVVMKRQLATAQAEGVARIQTSNTTYDEDQSWLDAHKPVAGAEFTGDQAKVLQAGADAIVAKRKALADEIQSDIADSKDENHQAVASKIDDWSQKAFVDGKPPAEAGPIISEAFAGDPAQRQKTMDALQQSADLGNASRSVETGSPEDDAHLQDTLQAAATSGNATVAQEAAKVQEAITKKRAAFAGDDPAGAAFSTSPAVTDAWTAWSQAPGDKTALRQAISLTQTEQQRQAVPMAKQKPLPASVAASITSQIMSQPAPKDQLAALLQFTDLGDAKTTNAVLAQLVGTKGLPDGSDLVVDIARTDKARAERVWTGLRAETKGVELPKEGKDAITNGLNAGLMAVLQGQAAITGNVDSATALAGPVLNAAQQYAKAKVMLGGDPAAAGRDAVTDLTGQYALLSDPALAQIYYPKAMETAAPGAVEAGLKVLRTDAAQTLKPQQRPGAPGTKVPANPYADATARDVESSAVWVNNGSGFALIVPGSNRALAFATYEQARDRGVKAIASGEAQPKTVPNQTGGAYQGSAYSTNPLGTMKPKGGQ